MIWNKFDCRKLALDDRWIYLHVCIRPNGNWIGFKSHFKWHNFVSQITKTNLDLHRSICCHLTAMANKSRNSSSIHSWKWRSFLINPSTETKRVTVSRVEWIYPILFGWRLLFLGDRKSTFNLKCLMSTQTVGKCCRCRFAWCVFVHILLLSLLRSSVWNESAKSTKSVGHK